jgi:hypothetical protein
MTVTCTRIDKRWAPLLGLASLLLALSACAPSVKVRSEVAPDSDLARYQTYGFFKQLGVEGENYSSIYGQHFRAAVSEQMEARGYRPSDEPQLLVNVTVGSEDKIRVNTYQEPYLYGGYYGRPYGMYYGPWGYPGATRTTVNQYTEANVYIDMVDAQEHKMVWQGVATFTVTEKMQKQLRESVYNTVNSVFAQYPVAPSTAE